MYTKLPVVKLATAMKLIVRSKSSLAQLEKFEKLRSLCCMSEMERRRLQAEAILGPKTKEYSPLPKLKNDEDEPYPEVMPADFCVEEAKLDKPYDIRNKKAVIVGGASGIGQETAQAMIKEGLAKVCLVDNRQEKVRSIVDKLNAGAEEPRAMYVMADVRSDCAYDMAYREILRSSGDIDIVLNCFEVYDETPECWEQMVKVNLLGTVRGTILAYHYLSGNCNGGVLINMTSYAALANVASMPIFSATSNAVVGLTSSFGQDFHFCNTRIRCCTLCPTCQACGSLRNMNKLHYRPEWAANSAAAMKCKLKQSPKDVAKGLVHIVKNGLRGVTYVMDSGKLYRYAMPNYKRILRREAYLL